MQECCSSYLKNHVLVNNRAVCPQCNRVIKGFYDYKAFIDYLRFCLARGRKTTGAYYKQRHIVTFKEAE